MTGTTSRVSPLRLAYTRLAVGVGLVAVAALAGCARDGGTETTPSPTAETAASPPVESLPLHGVWDLADVAFEFGACHEASVGFRPDGRYLAKSGDQVVTGRYVAERAVVGGRRGYLVVQRPEAHNGRPNCQGVPAARSVAASPPDAFIAVDGRDGVDRAWVYFGGQSGEPAAELVRRARRDP